MAKRGRRPNGEGSLFYDETRERWVGVIDLGAEDGRRVRRKVSGRTKKEAGERLNELRSERARLGTVASRDLTYGDVLTQWLETAAPSRVSPVTVANYTHLAHTHLTPALGAKPVSKLGPGDLERVLRGLARRGYSRSTIVRVRQIAAQSLDWAVRRRVTAWNPFRVAEIPPDAKQATERTSLSVDEVRRVIAVADTHRNGALVTLGLTAGLRPGELTALTWPSLDLEEGLVHVWQAWRGTGATRTLGEPKTAAAVRTIALPPVATRTLRRHRQAQAQERLASTWQAEYAEFVFVSEAGTPLDPANLRRLLRGIADAADIAKLTPYMLRHTATSILADAGVPNEFLADLLGHRTTRMVEQHYRHRLRAAVDVAVGPLEDLLGT